MFIGLTYYCVVTFDYLNQKINCCNELMKLIQPFQSQDDKSEEGTMNPLIGAFVSHLLSQSFLL